jgi:hypothetical protein
MSEARSSDDEEEEATDPHRRNGALSLRSFRLRPDSERGLFKIRDGIPVKRHCGARGEWDKGGLVAEDSVEAERPIRLSRRNDA